MEKRNEMICMKEMRGDGIFSGQKQDNISIVNIYEGKKEGDWKSTLHCQSIKEIKWHFVTRLKVCSLIFLKWKCHLWK